MAEITIRQVHGEEMLEAMYPLTQYALHPSPQVVDVMRKRFPRRLPYLHELF
jgi:hypothetical protein